MQPGISARRFAQGHVIDPIGLALLLLGALGAGLWVHYSPAPHGRRPGQSKPRVEAEVGRHPFTGDLLAGLQDLASQGTLSVEPVDVTASDQPPGSCTRLRMTLQASLPASLSVQPRRDANDARSVTTGDTSLDHWCSIQGRAGYLAAVLDGNTRVALLGAVRDRGVTIGAGALSLTEQQDAPQSRLLEAVALLDSLAKALRVRSDERGALLNNALNDREPGVGVRAAYELWRGYPQSAEACRLEREGLDGPKPWLVIAVARRIASERPVDARETLLALVSDGSVRTAFRRQSLDALVEIGIDARVQECLAKLLPRSSGELFGRLLCVLVDTPMRPSVDVLLVRARSLSVSARTVILDVASAYGEQGVVLLIQFLQDPAKALKRRAIESMGRLAGMESIPVLLAFAADPALPLSLRNAADEAVEAIRDRVGCQPGSLTLVEGGSAGALSVSDAGGEAGLELIAD